MSRITLRRLSRLEAISSHREARVHVIPALTEEEFETKRADLVTAGEVGPLDMVIHVRQFSDPAKPQCWGSLSALLNRVAAEGHRVFDRPAGCLWTAA